MLVAPRPLSAVLTASAVLPACSLVIPGRDDAAEYDDTSENHNFNDDPKIVVWRRANKAAIKIGIKPDANLAVDSEVTVGLVMVHTYTNTIIQQKELQKINHRVKLVLNLGKTTLGQS